MVGDEVAYGTPVSRHRVGDHSTSSLEWLKFTSFFALIFSPHHYFPIIPNARSGHQSTKTDEKLEQNRDF